MKIDVSKLGYRWKGNHTAATSYARGDVVRKNNDILYNNGSEFITMAGGQKDANSKGALASKNTANSQVTGASDQILHVGSTDNLEFQFSDGRNSTAVLKLAKALGGRYGGSDGRGGKDSMFAIMTDGSVRGWGNNSYYQLGIGSNTYARTLPKRVAFPSDAPEISEVYCGTRGSNYAVDTKGGLWGWGYGVNYSMGKEGDVSNVPIPEKMNGRGDIPEDAVITDVFQTNTNAQEYSTNYTATWCRDSKGNIYGWGSNAYNLTGTQVDSSNIESPTLMPLSQLVNIVDIMGFGNGQWASFFITDTGEMYESGQNYGLASNNSELSGRTTVPALWLPSSQDPVKKVIHSRNRYNTGASSFYDRFMLLTTNGKIYTWGTSGRGLTQTDIPNYVNTYTAVWDSRIDDVKDIGVSSGIGQSQYVLKNDGTVWGIGYLTDIDLSDNTTDETYHVEWVQMSFGNDNQEMVHTGDVGPTYNEYRGSGILLKKNNGNLFIIGDWDDNLSQSGGGTDQGVNNQPVFGEVRLPKAVDQFEILGGASRNNLFVQIGGEVFSAGYGSILGNEDNNSNRYCMSQLIF